jgi:DNA primase
VELLDARSVKERLPIAYVLDRYGIPVQVDGGAVAALCPFHPDSAPSLDVYGEQLERWGCYPCGLSGDVFDLVARLAWPGLSPTFAEVRGYALALLADYEASDWDGPTVGVERRFDPVRARVTVETSALRNGRPVVAFLGAKHARGELLGVDVMRLRTAWRVGSRLDEIIVPYYNRVGELVTYKHRTADTPVLAAPGSCFDDVLYGEWLDTDPSLPVLLCEGESDAWAAYEAAAGSYAVLAVPTGATSPPKAGQLAQVRGRRVLIAFDGDEAGAIGTELWCRALGEADILLMADGEDLAKLPPAQLRDALQIT